MPWPPRASMYRSAGGSRLCCITTPRSSSWVAPSSGNRNVLGSLLLAVHDQQGDLVYAGDVGTGFTDAARRQLLEQLRVLSRDEPPITGPTQLTHAWPGRPHVGASPCTGSSRAWSARSSTDPSARVAGFVIRPGEACVPIENRARCVGPRRALSSSEPIRRVLRQAVHAHLAVEGGAGIPSRSAAIDLLPSHSARARMSSSRSIRSSGVRLRRRRCGRLVGGAGRRCRCESSSARRS